MHGTGIYLVHGLLKHPELQRLLEMGLPFSPEVLQLYLPPSDVVKETTNDGHCIDLIRGHAGCPSFVMTLGGVKREGQGWGRMLKVVR